MCITQESIRDLIQSTWIFSALMPVCFNKRLLISIVCSGSDCFNYCSIKICHTVRAERVVLIKRRPRVQGIQGKVSKSTKLKIKDHLSFSWACCKHDIKPIFFNMSIHSFIPRPAHDSSFIPLIWSPPSSPVGALDKCPLPSVRVRMEEAPRKPIAF